MLRPWCLCSSSQHRQAKDQSNQDEYRAILMAAVHAEVTALQKSIDSHVQANRSAKADKAKRLLMTIFAMLEQIPWLDLASVNKGQGIEQRAKDTLLGAKEKA
jgi:hypothetical protein